MVFKSFAPSLGFRWMAVLDLFHLLSLYIVDSHPSTPLRVWFHTLLGNTYHHTQCQVTSAIQQSALLRTLAMAPWTQRPAAAMGQIEMRLTGKSFPEFDWLGKCLKLVCSCSCKGSALDNFPNSSFPLAWEDYFFHVHKKTWTIQFWSQHIPYIHVSYSGLPRWSK